MKVNMKDNKTGIIGLIIILSVLVIGAITYFITDIFLSKCDEKKICDKNYVFKKQCLKLDDCPKFSECPKQRVCPKVDEVKADEAYKTFVDNYVKYRNNFKSEIQDIRQIMQNDEGHSWVFYAYVDSKGDLYLTLENEKLIAKYGEVYKILSGALTVDVFEDNYGFYKQIVTIMEDGSISVINQADTVRSNTLVVKNYKEYKNIVGFKRISKPKLSGQGSDVIILAVDIMGETREIPFDL